MEILRQLAAGREKTLDELALKLQRDRSTVHRSLTKLLTIGVCYRKTVGLKGGGYFHIYGISDTSIIKRRIEGEVSEIITALQHLAERFESDFLNGLMDSAER